MTDRTRRALFALVAIGALLASACSPAVSAANTIDLTITEARIAEFLRAGKPATELRVKAGQEYVFRITNAKYDHNFFIGRAEDLAARNYDTLVGTPLWSAGTREVRYTFKKGDALQFACTLSGHYGMMHGDFVVES
jgi:uncharacterized cupredoxin-like copper-binding protein